MVSTMTTRTAHMHNEGETGFPKLSAPARRALAGAGYTRLDQLAKVTEPDLASLHGIGLTTIASLRQALHARGLSFRTSPPMSERHKEAGSAGAAVEEYLRGLEEPKRITLEALRQTIL